MGYTGDWILSVGATPTAHAAVSTTHVDEVPLEGELELYVPIHYSALLLIIHLPLNPRRSYQPITYPPL
jgi:hypothetical protein